MSDLTIAKPPIEKVNRTPVVFENRETHGKLAGIVYTPRTMESDAKLPALIIGGPMLSVKELVQSLYGQILAEKGYLVLVFDHSTIGSSEGHPRGLEDPELKGEDLRSAVDFLATYPNVDANRIGAIGICGSGSYVPNGLRNDNRVKAIVSVVPFTIMNMVNTGTDEEILAQKAAYEEGAEPARLDLIKGSEGEAYYFDTDRGAAANMVNPVSWSELAWHVFNPTETIKDVHVPYLVITAENAFTRQGAEEMFKNANEPKEFHLVPKARHFDMYDVEPYVDENISVITDFLGRYL